MRKSTIRETNSFYFLTQEDRISYSYKFRVEKNKRILIDIINVSYDFLYKNKWVTIIHYDTIHVPGLIHVHLLQSLKPKRYQKHLLIELKGLANNAIWFTTIQEHLRERYIEYKRDFKRLS